MNGLTNSELLEYCREYDSDEDIGNTENTGHHDNGPFHPGGADGIYLANSIFENLKKDRDERWGKIPKRAFSDESHIFGDNSLDIIGKRAS